MFVQTRIARGSAVAVANTDPHSIVIRGRDRCPTRVTGSAASKWRRDQVAFPVSARGGRAGRVAR
jgi:hypothetical protein